MPGAALPSSYTLPARPARSFFIDENKSPDGPFLLTKSIQETPWNRPFLSRGNIHVLECCKIQKRLWHRLKSSLGAIYFDLLPSRVRAYWSQNSHVADRIPFRGHCLAGDLPRIHLEGDRLVADVLDLVDVVGGFDRLAHRVIAGDGRGPCLTGRQAHAGEPCAWRRAGRSGRGLSTRSLIQPNLNAPLRLRGPTVANNCPSRLTPAAAIHSLATRCAVGPSRSRFHVAIWAAYSRNAARSKTKACGGGAAQAAGDLAPNAHTPGEGANKSPCAGCRSASSLAIARSTSSSFRGPDRCSFATLLK